MPETGCVLVCAPNFFLLVNLQAELGSPSLRQLDIFAAQLSLAVRILEHPDYASQVPEVNMMPVGKEVKTSLCSIEELLSAFFDGEKYIGSSTWNT